MHYNISFIYNGVWYKKNGRYCFSFVVVSYATLSLYNYFIEKSLLY